MSRSRSRWRSILGELAHSSLIGDFIALSICIDSHKCHYSYNHLCTQTGHILIYNFCFSQVLPASSRPSSPSTKTHQPSPPFVCTESLSKPAIVALNSFLAKLITSSLNVPG